MWEGWRNSGIEIRGERNAESDGARAKEEGKGARGGERGKERREGGRARARGERKGSE